jgi:hypothetical protein
MKEEIIQEFYSPEIDKYFTVEELSQADPELQQEVMRHWFFKHYEDPAERTPYESKEGGYIYIWGGPYYAHEVIEEMFGEIVPEDAKKRGQIQRKGDRYKEKGTDIFYSPPVLREKPRRSGGFRL